MKKTILVFCLIAGTIFLINCHPGKKAQATKTPEIPKLTFDANVKMLIETKCSPCHTNEKGRLPAYITYDIAKRDVDDIISRVHLNPGDKGFMPAKNPKLSDSAIRVIEQWKADGLLEK